MPPWVQALVDQKTFGRLTVLRAYHEKPCWRVEFRCQCGKTKVARAANLKAGHTRSCGCLNSEQSSRRASERTSHGLSGTPAYAVWSAMIRRCKDPKDKHYKDYGARGIEVDPRWLDVRNFVTDMGQPAPDQTLDRVLNDGPYAPGNCRWATVELQMNNKRSNITLTYQGETLTVSQWARKVGLKPATLAHRVRSGCPIEDALTLPVNFRFRRAHRP